MLPWRYLFVFLCMISFVHKAELRAAGGESNAAEGKTSNYSDALQNYRNDHYKEAAKQLKAILQQDPRNEDANLLLGTIYYQSQRFKKARLYFDKAEAGALTAETAFAWGTVYWNFGDYKRAIQGFKMALKKRAPYRQYSLYYTAVSYYKIGMLSRARRFFQNVESEQLPVNMQVNRRKYLKNIQNEQDKMLQSVIGSSSGGINDESIVDSDQNASRERDGADDDAEDFKFDVKKIDKEPEQENFKKIYRPSLTFQQFSSNLDNFGVSRDSVNITAHRETVEGLFATPKSKWSPTLILAAGNAAYQASFLETNLFRLEQTSGNFTSQSTKTSSVNAGFFKISPSIEAKISESIQLNLSLLAWGIMPRYSTSAMSGENSVQLSSHFESDVFDFGVEASLQNIFDKDLGKSANDIVVQARLAKVFGDFHLNLDAHMWNTDNSSLLSSDHFRRFLIRQDARYRVGFAEEFGGSAALTYSIGDLAFMGRAESFSRGLDKGSYLDRLNTLDSNETTAKSGIKLMGSAQIALWDNFTLSGLAALNNLTGYGFTDKEVTDNPSYQADLQQIIYQAGIQIPFTDWLRLNGQYSMIANDYQNSIAKVSSFRINNPRDIVETDIIIEIQKQF